ncbi:MAG: heme lyase CcmF/NrfE family subunit [Anaerolineae bacterium]|nr:heme lyase CcmF/NrfE family subunit [Anaerolineae bacterium]
MIAVTLGQWALWIALAIALYGMIASILGARQRVPELVQSGRNAVIAVAALAVVASGSLLYLLLTRNFQVDYVYQHVSTYLPVPYVISAFYAGQEGSLLLWLLFLAVAGAIAVLHRRDWNEDLLPYVGAVVSGVAAFFLLLLVTLSSPFKLLPGNPGEGMGLNPLLENPGMIYHPPTLFIGYAVYTIPFAYAIAALATGRVGSGWVRGIRLWSLFAWLFLGIGILLGAQWAYVELGWGGYWAWDPVENSSLIPWLVGTAFLHSVMVQERRGMFKRWNVLLATLTFALCVFATFVTRSGLIESVHAFQRSPLGYYFLAFLFIVLVATVALAIWRRKELASKREMESFLSREFSLLVTVLGMVGIGLAVLLGTLYPTLAQALSGRELSVGPAFYSRVFTPLGAAVIIVIAICPLLAWGKSSPQRVLRAMLWPGVMAIVFGIALAVAGIRPLYAVLGFAACVFVFTSVLVEFGRGWFARKRMTGESYPVAFLRLVNKNHRRYGGYLVHLAIVILAAGVIGSSVYKTSTTISMRPGEAMQVQGYTLKYAEYTVQPTEAKQRFAVTLDVSKGNRSLGRLTAEKNFHWNVEQWVTEVAIRPGLVEDLYVILSGLETNGLATLEVQTHPMVTWLWIGGGLLFVGTLWAMWPRSEKKRAAGRAE